MLSRPRILRRRSHIRRTTRRDRRATGEVTRSAVRVRSSTTMRILMVNKYAHVTAGADRQCLALVRALREAGHDVVLLSTADDRNEEHVGHFVPTSVTHETRDDLPPRRMAGAFRDALWNRAAARGMKRLIDDFKPDVVHSHKLYPQLSVAPLVVARRRALPVVQTIHDYEFLSASAFDTTGGWRDRREPRFPYRALSTATFVVRRRIHRPAVTEWVAISNFVAQAHASHGITATVVPNFADIPGAGARSSSARDGVLFLGLLSDEKGVSDLLRVAELMPDVPVVVAGRGPLTELVRVASERLPNLEFRGYVSAATAAEAMRSASVALIPSRWEEPGSLVALEAMAVGTPVVAYQVGGLGETVASTGAGLVVRDEPVRLVEACRRLLSDTTLWKRCSLAGVDAIQTSFSRAAHVDAITAVYGSAISRRRPSSY
jgi:glycosyltransferase involved in cell wall biosynthesis